MHLKMRFQMHLKNAFKRWEIFPKGLLKFLILYFAYNHFYKKFFISLFLLIMAFF